MKTKIIILSLILIIGVIFAAIDISEEFNITGQASNQYQKSGQTQSTGSGSNIKINKQNLAQYLEKQSLVRDLPDDSVILLKFYNFHTGAREWEESYVIENNNVKKSTSKNPDIIIWMASEYIPELNNLYKTMKKAKANNDIGYSLEISRVGFMWRYRSMFGYRDCFGL